MGLNVVLSRAAASRAHVLVTEAPGAFRERIALERAVYAAGWCLADSVADADVLAVVGEPGPELMALIEHTWEQLSEPRARIEVRDESAAVSSLADARAALLAPKKREPATEDGLSEHEHDHGGHDHGGHDHGGHDHGEMSPDGIPLAEGAEDRDGLEMDELHLPLGPVLSHWPAGLVLRLTLHGDVVSHAEIEHLDGGPDGPTRDDPPTQAARLLDAAASVLTLAGLPGEAARARRVRDACLDVGPVDVEAIADLSRRVRRHRTLRLMLKGLDLAGEGGASRDLHESLVALVDRARAAIEGGPGPTYPVGPTLAALPGLLTGHELAAVRLWMAALSADPTFAVPAEAMETSDG